MKLYYNKNAKDPIYYIQQGFRNGNKTSTRNIRRIGRHSELLAVTDDPLSYAKEQVRLMNEQMQNQKLDTSLTIDFAEKVTASDAHVSRALQQNIGYLVLQKLYHDLKIRSFIEGLQQQTKAQFPCDDVLRFLIFARILDPRSKKGTFDRLDTYFDPPSVSYQHILRTMDLLEDHSSAYLNYLYHASSEVIRRDTSVFYYDCTNFYFEREYPDEDMIDPVTGEYFPGLRKYGFAKDHKPNPLVEMGLFMDRNGIPVSMCLHPGNTSESTTAIPLEKEVVHMLDGKPVIYCADAGLCAYAIRNYNSIGGRRFVVTQSIKKLSGPLQEAVFNDLDYLELSTKPSEKKPASLLQMQTEDLDTMVQTGRYDQVIAKEIPDVRMVDLGIDEAFLCGDETIRGKAKGMLKQRIIVTFSRKAMEYQRRIRNRQIERAKELMLQDPESVKKGPHDVRRFLKQKNRKESIEYVLDEEKIRYEEQYDGFYAVATNLEDDIQTILTINERRYKIEECFRIMKTTFRSRPVYHSRENRIRAHFLICYTALLIYRILEVQLEEAQQKRPEQERTHFTTNEIIETLQNMNVCNFKDLFYQATYDGGKVLYALNDLQELGLDKRYYQPKELRKILRNLKR